MTALYTLSDEQVAVLDRRIPPPSRDASLRFTIENRTTFSALQTLFACDDSQYQSIPEVVGMDADRDQLELLRELCLENGASVVEQQSTGRILWLAVTKGSRKVQIQVRLSDSYAPR